MNPHYDFVAQRAGFRCEYCHAPDWLFNFALEVDHFIPNSAGGSDGPENLALACRSCNAYKSFHQLGLTTDGEETPLFDPRKDVWNEHFRLNTETGEIEGLTSIGTGTSVRLRLNNFFQVRARRLWLRKGLIAEQKK